jgi:acyl dehydratase
MPLDVSFTGRTLASELPYEVGREKIREFADAIGDPSPVYRDSEAAKALGYRDVIAPPTFPVVFTFPAARPLLVEMGIEPSRIVHGDQRFRYSRPIHPGDVLTCVVSIENIRSLAGSDMMVMRTDVTADNGEQVLTTWSTLVVR